MSRDHCYVDSCYDPRDCIADDPPTADELGLDFDRCQVCGERVDSFGEIELPDQTFVHRRCERLLDADFICAMCGSPIEPDDQNQSVDGYLCGKCFRFENPEGADQCQS